MIPSTEVLGILWMLRLSSPLPGDIEPEIEAVFLRAGQESAEELAQAMGLDNPSPVLERFRRGRDCYIGRTKDKIATYGWITYDQEAIGELGLLIRLNRDEAYIWDCATLPAYRGRLLYPALIAHMLRELQKAGFERIWIGTDADNLASQHGLIHTGCQPILEIIRSPERGFLSRGRPGVSVQDLLDAHYALFGNRDLTRVVIPQS